MLAPNQYSFQFLSRAKVKALKIVPEVVVEPSAPVVSDSGKRTFLRLAGLVGVGLVASSVLPKKAEAYVLGGAPTSPVVGLKNSSNIRVNPATDDTLQTISAQTSKMTFDGSGDLYVQAATNFSSQLENASSVVINPATEDSLAAIKAQTNKLTFDGSNNLLTSGSGGAGGTVSVQDTTGTQINPATEDSLILLRRMVKLMESQAAVDSSNRQRITLDSLGPATAITNTVPVSGTVTVSSITAGTVTVGNASLATTVSTLAGQNDQMFQDFARTAYATGIRQNLVFS